MKWQYITCDKLTMTHVLLAKLKQCSFDKTWCNYWSSWTDLGLSAVIKAATLTWTVLWFAVVELWRFGVPLIDDLLPC